MREDGKRQRERHARCGSRLINWGRARYIETPYALYDVAEKDEASIGQQCLRIDRFLRLIIEEAMVKYKTRLKNPKTAQICNLRSRRLVCLTL